MWLSVRSVTRVLSVRPRGSSLRGSLAMRFSGAEAAPGSRRDRGSPMLFAVAGLAPPGPHLSPPSQFPEPHFPELGGFEGGGCWAGHAPPRRASRTAAASGAAFT